MSKQPIIVFWSFFAMHYSIFNWPDDSYYQNGHVHLTRDNRHGIWNHQSLLLRNIIDNA